MSALLPVALAAPRAFSCDIARSVSLDGLLLSVQSGYLASQL
jgi:hypothetical protein